jgi:1-acyl-sn-glycerol-3-phosphate acyltransferase
MKSLLRSIWMWIATSTLILIWLPLLGVVRLFDRDPVRLRTGLWFRRLGRAVVKSNPAWKVHISGINHAVAKQPYIVVSNHQSVVDIPLISCLPWEMKWIAKEELFRVPVVGWMMRLAGDIPLDRSYRNGAQALLRAKSYLQQKCPVMFFPEGTRSVDDRVHAFTDGAAPGSRRHALLFTQRQLEVWRPPGYTLEGAASSEHPGHEFQRRGGSA